MLVALIYSVNENYYHSLLQNKAKTLVRITPVIIASL
jgi:hypothetical protein